MSPKFSHLHCDRVSECSLDFSFKKNLHIKISLCDTFLFMYDVKVLTAGVHTFVPRTINLNRKVFPFAYGTKASSRLALGSCAGDSEGEAGRELAALG